MTRVEAALNRLRETGAKISGMESPYPLANPSFGPGCHEAEIDEIRGKWPLPPDYREFLSRCRRVDASDVFNGYSIFSPIAVATSDGPRILHVELNGVLDEVHVLAVGGDGGGNLFLMGRTPNACGVVWKWDHEQEERFDRVAREGLLYVSGSFAELLERVAEDWEHFVAGDHSWKYLSG